jgi:hypothetical protein
VNVQSGSRKIRKEHESWIERIDSSSGAIGSAVNEAGIQLAALQA